MKKEYFAAYTQFHGQTFCVEIGTNNLSLVVRNTDGSFKQTGKTIEITKAETVNTKLFAFQPRFQFKLGVEKVTDLQCRDFVNPSKKEEREWIIEKAAKKLFNSVNDLFPQNQHIQYAD